MYYRTLLIMTLILFTGSCTINQSKKPLGEMNVDIDVNSISPVASTMIKSIIEADIPTSKDGTKYTFVTGKIVNKTPYQIDTDRLMEIITQEINNNEVLIPTNSLQIGQQYEFLRYSLNLNLGSDEHPVPQVSLAGKIIQRSFSYKNRDIQGMEIYFQLRLTDLNTGQTIWQNTRPLVKSLSEKG